ncbi:MAG TPA: cation transporter [Pseudolabrys sp.]|nr:cation transporter [Pseudolabrys sp.]
MITLKIEGMTCGHCVKAVTEALSEVPGVQKVEGVSLEQKQAVVSGDPKPDALVSAVEEAGYEARVA